MARFYRFIYGIKAKGYKAGKKFERSVRAILFTFSRQAPTFNQFKRYVEAPVLIFLEHILIYEEGLSFYETGEVDNAILELYEVEEDEEVSAVEARGIGFYYIRFRIDERFDIPTILDVRRPPSKFW